MRLGCGNPDPTKGLHESMKHLVFNTAGSFCWPEFGLYHLFQSAIYFLIWPLGSDGYGATNAIVCFALVPGSGSTTIVLQEFHCVFSRLALHSPPRASRAQAEESLWHHGFLLGLGFLQRGELGLGQHQALLSALAGVANTQRTPAGET